MKGEENGKSKAKAKTETAPAKIISPMLFIASILSGLCRFCCFRQTRPRDGLFQLPVELSDNMKRGEKADAKRRYLITSGVAK